MIRVGIVLAMLLLASCPRASIRAVPAAPDLETAAIARGLISDPDTLDIVGLYARDTDRLCIVRSGGGYRIGGYVDYGEGVNCSGVGSVSRSGSSLRVKFGDACAFDARFEGERIVFPAQLPEGCARLCGRRASFAAINVMRLSAVPSEAAAMRDARGSLPCASAD